jgi:two-component system invasion response regulator UvrY
MVIRVLLVDDHAVVRQGVARILERSSDFLVAGEAADGPGALDGVAGGDIDVCVLDLDMPGGGLSLIRRLLERAPDLRILVLSQHADGDFALQCLADGAHGYCSKAVPFETVESAIRRVASGRRYLSELTQELAVERFVTGGPGEAPHTSLSSRELDVLLRLARGQRVGEIAIELGISFKTVSTYRSRVLEKLGAANNVELALYARDHGLL